MPGYRDIWRAACASATSSDDSKALKLFHTAVIHHLDQVSNGLMGESGDIA